MKVIAIVASSIALLSGLTRPTCSQEPTVRAHTDLVVLHVAVLDQRSRFVPGLAQDRFTVYEDGVPQTVRFFSDGDRAASIGLIVDNSGSMYRKRDEVAAAGRLFLGVSNPLDEFFVAHFNETVILMPADVTSLTTDHAAVEQALDGIAARGQTALYDAVTQGLDRLRYAHNPHRVLVVVSDGGDNASVTRLDALLQRVQQSDTIIYTIGLFDEDSRDRNARVLKMLADVTGGEAFLPGRVQGAMTTLERRLPRQADSSFGDCATDDGLGRNVSGGFRPRLS